MLRGRVIFPQRFRFPYLQVGLAKFGGLNWIHSRLQIGLLQEVTPALVVIWGTLGVFKLFQFCFSVLLAPDYLNNSARPVRPDVMANDSVGRIEFVVCQNEPIEFLFA